MRIEDLWFANDRIARLARAALAPLSKVFSGIVATRNVLYDRGMIHVVPSPVPTISVGNISVGGTGKTPVAAYFVRRLRELGRTPAIVMRGYGDDEPAVHRLLNPGVAVHVNANRASGIGEAVMMGADVVVLDDAFQHRKAERHIDVVLVSAERWRNAERLLPAGSLRESPASLARASLILITHKVAPDTVVDQTEVMVRQAAPGVPVARVHLEPRQLERADQSAPPLDLATLAGADVLAVAGVGDPESFFLQLDAVGASVTRRRFADHHSYTATEVAALVEQAKNHKYVVSTLKDTVKLRRLWPPKGPALWYVSQAVAVCPDEGLIDAALRQLLLL